MTIEIETRRVYFRRYFDSKIDKILNKVRKGENQLLLKFLAVMIGVD